MNQYDITIIGAGAVGNAIARELSKYKLSVCVLEKEYDVAFGTSGRNSGVLHAGFNNKQGTLMAELCVKGSQGFEIEAETLGIDFKRTGKLVTALFEDDLPALEKLKVQGEKNGVKGLSIISDSQIKEINENVQGIAALYSEKTGIFDPFEYTIALAEEAILNGVHYNFGYEVNTIQIDEAEKYKFTIKSKSNQGETISSKYIINSAGLFSDGICRMVGINDYLIQPCRGEYHILGQEVSKNLNIPVYPVPNEKAGGLGVHLTPTIHGNLMIGPSAEYIGINDDYACTESVMNHLFSEGSQLFPDMKKSDIIRSFSGIRPKLTSKELGGYADFIIEESESVLGFIILVGIESPGLTAAIPIARKVVDILAIHCRLERKNIYRKRKDRQDIINEGSNRIICRCEKKTEQDVLKAFDSIIRIGAIPTMKGIKNRIRTGMGCCQGGFCSTEIVSLLKQKRDMNPLELCDDREGSYLFAGRNRK